MQHNTQSAESLARLCGVTANANFRSVFSGLVSIGEDSQLNHPVNLVPFLAQIAHESMNFRHDRELWGPTPAQQRYDIRTDLGNTPERDGDGKLYMGRTAMQITGAYNTRRFWEWCKRLFKNVPDFMKTPDQMNTDPWEGLGPIWFWDEGNRTGKSLNVYARSGNFEMITRIINGGLNGYADRCEKFDAISLRFLGYTPNEIGRFQRDRKIKADGISGPVTRAEMTAALKGLNPIMFIGAPDLAPKQAAKSLAPTTPTKRSFGQWLEDLLKPFFKKG